MFDQIEKFINKAANQDFTLLRLADATLEHFAPTGVAAADTCVALGWICPFGCHYNWDCLRASSQTCSRPVRCWSTLGAGAYYEYTQWGELCC